ncbi:MAG: cytochrome C551 [Clostridia bacterium]|nr:cytochrome C551 [Clostridia bacterium]
MADIELTCKDCGNTFVFTEGEQEFYAQKGFSNPVRCQECRQKRKANKANQDDQNNQNN